MKVSELIAFLKTQPQHLPVAFRCCSEYCTLEAKEIEVKQLCPVRTDGWIADKRPDNPSVPYLVFPGN